LDAPSLSVSVAQHKIRGFGSVVAMVLRAIAGATINPQAKYTSATAIPHADLLHMAIARG